MAKILAFAGSNSLTSINYELVKYTSSLMQGHLIQQLDMVHYPFPMYSEDAEKENGYSNSMVEFLNYIKNADGLILSVNEHNGNLSAYFKNVLDWLSRIERKFLEGTKVLLMATSPGKRGAISALEIASKTLPRFGAEVIGTFSLPNFPDNFDAEKGVLEADLLKAHQQLVASFLAVI